MKKILNKDCVFLSMIFLVGLSVDIFAQENDSAKLFLDDLVKFLINSIGPGVIAVSFVMAGFAFARSEQEGIKKAIQVFIAGAFIALATWLSELVFGWG